MTRVMDKTYRIDRAYADRNKPRDIGIITGLTLEEAQEHCSDPETSSSTATTPEAHAVTAEYGDWFDCYYEE